MRDPLRKVPVRTKLTLLFVGICLIAFGAGGWLAISSSKSALENEIQQRMRLQSRALAEALDAGMRTLMRRAEDFASDGYIRSHTAEVLNLSQSPEADGPRNELLRHLRQNNLPLVGAFADLSVISLTGEVLLCARGDASAVPADLARVGLSSGESKLSGLMTRRDLGDAPLVAISTPLYAVGDKTPIGKLLAWVHTGVWIASSLKDAGVRGRDVADDVRLAVHDNSGLVLTLPTHFTSGLPAAVDSELVLTGFGMHLETSDKQPPTDDSRFPMGHAGYSVRVERRDPRAFEVVAGLQSRFVLVGCALALLTGLLMLLPVHFIAHPLMRLTEAQRRVREGTQGVRVEVQSADEIGQLAEGFNHMAQAVEERTHALEQVASDLGIQRLELRRESARLNAVLSSMQDALIVLDHAGQPVVCNAAGRTLLPLLKPAATPAFQPHHSCQGAPLAESDCTRCLLDPGAEAKSCILDAGQRTWEIHASRLMPDEGVQPGRVLLARDITERTQAEERQTHQERLAVLGEVASVMAHELNNPLAAIAMFAQMSEDLTPVGSDLHENLVVIRRNTDNCKRAIRELLDYATDTSPEIHAVNMHTLIEDVAHFLRPIRERARVELDLNLQATLAEVTGDDVQLRQIFVNLLVNAFQAMAERGGLVSVRTQTLGDHLEIDVADDGPGIPEHARELIFKPFYTTKPRGVGTGLGLPTARRIAELHGGSLELASTGPTGTLFRVRLRLAGVPV
jgi:signal transduction histidine kinase